MKHYTLLNRNVDHSIPQIVKNALFSLNLYKEIPIVNGVLMAPYANDLSEYKGKTQKIWKNGKLNRLNQFKLQSLIYKNEKMRREKEKRRKRKNTTGNSCFNNWQKTRKVFCLKEEEEGKEETREREKREEKREEARKRIFTSGVLLENFFAFNRLVF